MDKAKKEYSVEEIRYLIRKLSLTVIDILQVKGIARKMVENNLDAFLEDEDNEIDIQLAFYKIVGSIKEL